MTIKSAITNTITIGNATTTNFSKIKEIYLRKILMRNIYYLRWQTTITNNFYNFFYEKNISDGFLIFNDSILPSLIIFKIFNNFIL